MILKYKDIAKKLESKYFFHSSINSENTFSKIMADIKPVPTSIVEIGTYFGISTAILASICKVYTFDVRYFPEVDYVWSALGVKENIRSYIVENSDWTKIVLKDIPFDFAIIDSVHDEDNARKDFDIVKKCGRVLFHDNNDRFPGVQKFCKEIGCKKIKEFGYWEAI